MLPWLKYFEIYLGKIPPLYNLHSFSERLPEDCWIYWAITASLIYYWLSPVLSAWILPGMRLQILDANRMKLISWVEGNAGWLCHNHGGSSSGKQVEEQGRLCPRLNRKSSVRCYTNECRFSQEIVLRSRSNRRCCTSDRANMFYIPSPLGLFKITCFLWKS